MAKIIRKGLIKADNKILLKSSLIGPIMMFPKKNKQRPNNNLK